MSTTGPSVSERLEHLLVLQDHDLHVEQLIYRRAHLESHAALVALSERLGKLDQRLARIAAERETYYTRYSELESHIEEAKARIAEIEQRLSGNAAASFRDQESMALEIGSLAKRRRELEDSELELMEVLEPLDKAISELGAERAELMAKGRDLQAQIKADEQALDAEIAELAEQRANLVAAVPEDLVREYERLRTRLDGVGAARIVHNTCSGCNLLLPATEIDHIRHAGPDAIFHCDQCGRILVP